jgi:hypothetical protein
MYSRKTPDDGQRRCSKYVEFYGRIKYAPANQTVNCSSILTLLGSGHQKPA